METPWYQSNNFIMQQTNSIDSISLSGTMSEPPEPNSHNSVPLAVSIPNNACYPTSQNKQMPDVYDYFTNIAAVKQMGVLQEIGLFEIRRGISLICQNTTMRLYGAWIRVYHVLYSKSYCTFSGLFWSPAGSRQATRCARLCETR